MAKWNPFEKNVLNPDPDEFSGEENAGYGIPRDADSEDSFSQDAASSGRPEETDPAQPEDPADTDSQPEELSSVGGQRCYRRCRFRCIVRYCLCK